MRKVLLLLTIFYFFAPSEVVASQKWTYSSDTQIGRDAHKTVHINVGDITSFPELPTVELMRAMRHFSKTQMFRATWFSQFGSTLIDGTALYNRSKQNIRVFTHVQSGRKKYNNFYLFQKVTARNVEQLGTYNSGKHVGDQSGNFSNLAKFGVEFTSTQRIHK